MFWVLIFFSIIISFCSFSQIKLGFIVWLKLFLFCEEFLHVKPGKGAAFVRTKIRNYVTGNTVEKTFRAGSSVIYF